MKEESILTALVIIESQLEANTIDNDTFERYQYCMYELINMIKDKHLYNRWLMRLGQHKLPSVKEKKKGV